MFVTAVIGKPRNVHTTIIFNLQSIEKEKEN
jgi:hypothetical protein